MPAATTRATVRGLAGFAVPMAFLLAAPSAAQAGIAAGAGPIFPTATTVGQTVTAAIELRNDNTSPNDTATNTVCNLGDAFPCPSGDPGVTLIPTCGLQGAFSSCAPGGADPGVFQVHPLATGVSGTACAAMTFDVTLSDPTFGRLRVAPRGGGHMLLPGNNAYCQIALTFDVAKVPTIDIDPVTTGVQTAQIVDNTQTFGSIIASGRGSSAPVTVLQANPGIATTASPDIKLGAGRLVDNAVVSGRVSPQASTIDFRLYGPDDANCSRAAVFQSLGQPYPIGGGQITSGAYTPTAPGTYRWRATYNGDTNNAVVSGACNEANETVSVTKVCDPAKEVCGSADCAITNTCPPVCDPKKEVCETSCSPPKADEDCPEIMRASLRAVPRCDGGPGYGRTNAPFNVVVTVTGSAKYVQRVEFRRNHYLVKRLTKAGANGRYVLRVDPRRLAAGRNHEIQTVVVVRAPASFSSRRAALRKNLRTVRFAPVRRCRSFPSPPPPPPG